MTEREVGEAGLRAFREALGRYERHLLDPPAAFAAAVEAVLWVSVIDEIGHSHDRTNYLARRDKDPSGKYVQALREPRNTIAHHIRQIPLAHKGAFSTEFSKEFDRVRMVWDKPPASTQWPGYDTLLLAQEVSIGLTAAAAWLEAVVRQVGP